MTTLAASPTLTTHQPASPTHELVIRAWAHALFCSPLRPNADPDPVTVCFAVAEELTRTDGREGGCMAKVAQDAGDYPDTFPARMAWSLRTAEHAYIALATQCACASLPADELPGKVLVGANASACFGSPQ